MMYKILMVDYRPESEKQRWKELLEAAQDELVDALKQRISLDVKIRTLQKDITNLAGLCDVELEDPIKELGLTDAVRYIVGSRNRMPIAPTEIRDALEAKGYDVKDYKNLMASIHTILKRLAEKREVLPYDNQSNRYIWTGGLTPVPPYPFAKDDIEDFLLKMQGKKK